MCNKGLPYRAKAQKAVRAPMIISHNQLQAVLRAYSQSVQKTAQKDGDNKSVSGEKPLYEDQLSLSPQAQELQKIIEIAKNTPAAREEKVAQIRAQLAQGTYQIDSADLAEKMLARLLADELL